MLTQDERHLVERLATEYGYEVAILFAIIEVESGGRVHAVVDGRKLPLIRFEGHWFDRLLPRGYRELARIAGLASPTPGAIRNPVEQKHRWQMLESACAIDEESALGATSWGVGQVMGFHWRALGFKTAQALRAQACEDLEGQLRLMLRFLSVNHLQTMLQSHDWTGFARMYNGLAFRKNNYHLRFAEAYRKHAAQRSVSKKQ